MADGQKKAAELSEAELLKRADIPHVNVPVARVSSGGMASKFDEEVRAAKATSAQLNLEIKQEKLKKLKQQHTQRTVFFSWAVITISVVLASSAAFMIAYMAVKGDQTEPAVMIAWLSSGLVETLGLGYIIANYLFEQKGTASKKAERKNRGGNARN